MDAGFLSKKVILILSPQSWGNMLLSKHHYAIELAKRGNKVYYLNPPDNVYWNLKSRKNRITILSSPIHANLFLIDQKLFFPYNLKFHSRRLYNILIKKQILDILRIIDVPVDIIWSFDLGHHFPLAYFDRKKYKVFHPVDEPGDHQGILAAAGANIIFSVTKEIMEKYKSFRIPSYFINHGLADEFLPEENDEVSKNNHINIGMSGNLLRPDLDRKILLQIISENPDLVFHFFGGYFAGQSNLAAVTSREVEIFIETLKGFDNVILHGVLRTNELAKELNRMDALLICYDMQTDQSKGTNYHKVMEYLSTGRVIISNNITTYSGYPGLVRMITERENNETLPALFKETINNLEKWNSEALSNERKSFARNNTYQKQIDRIEVHITGLLKSGSYKSNKTLILES